MKYLFLLLLSIPLVSYSQELEELDNLIIIDSLYREDQIYVGLTFNFLTNTPSDFSQNGLSVGLQAGFIRDFPVNKRRNKAFGIGLGIAVDTYNHNLFIGKQPADSKSIYKILGSGETGQENRFTYYTIEAPLEYRWRTSTPTRTSFWRIHTGFRLGYIVNFKSTFVPNEGAEIVRNDIPEVNRFQYGPSLSFGYGAFNFQGYYGLENLFNDQAVTTNNNNNVNLQAIRLGLIFYFL